MQHSFQLIYWVTIQSWHLNGQFFHIYQELGRFPKKVFTWITRGFIAETFLQARRLSWRQTNSANSVKDKYGAFITLCQHNFLTVLHHNPFIATYYTDLSLNWIHISAKSEKSQYI